MKKREKHILLDHLKYIHSPQLTYIEEGNKGVYLFLRLVGWLEAFNKRLLQVTALKLGDEITNSDYYIFSVTTV